MPTTFDNLQMGPCSVTFKTTDLGLTKGGVEVDFGTDVASIVADQYGDTIINEIIKGRNIKVKVPLAESDLTKLAAVFPGTTLVGSSAKKLVFNTSVGTSLRALGGTLVLHPKDRASGDKSFDLNIPVAMCKGDMKFAYKQDEQRVYMVEFVGYPDLTSGDLWFLGDPAAA